MKLIFATLLIILSFSAFSQKERKLDEFSGVVVRGNFTIKLVKSTENKLLIEEGDQSADDIVTDKIKNNRLSIKLKNNVFQESSMKLTLYYTESLNFIEAKNGMVITANEPIENEDLELICFAGGEIHIKIKTKKLITSVKQGGKIIISGEADTHTAKVNTGGTIEAYSVLNKTTSANINAGGRIKVTPKNTLFGKVLAGGTINFRGNPETIQKVIKLGGKIEQQ